MLASRDFSIELPTEPYPWWEIFLGQNKTIELITAANIILGLVIELEHDSKIEGLVTSKAFVRSILKSGQSFNDPQSFLWDYQMEVFAGN